MIPTIHLQNPAFSSMAVAAVFFRCGDRQDAQGRWNQFSSGMQNRPWPETPGRGPRRGVSGSMGKTHWGNPLGKPLGKWMKVLENDDLTSLWKLENHEGGKKLEAKLRLWNG